LAVLERLDLSANPDMQVSREEGAALLAALPQLRELHLLNS
jgi:hypothetical protein